jgi:hypothetical protein
VVNDSLYTLQLSASPSFSLRIINDNLITDTSVSLPPALLANGFTYYWKVACTKKGGQVTAFSSPWSFSTIGTLPTQVVLHSPATGDTVRTDSVLLGWSHGSPDVDKYRVEYASDSMFTSATIDSSVIDSFKLVRDLQNNTTMWWRVKAHNVAGWGIWSAKGLFSVKIKPVSVSRSRVPTAFGLCVSGGSGIITYALPKAERVSLRMYSLSGKLQWEAVNARQEAGYYWIKKPAATAAGNYVVVFEAGSYCQRELMNSVR